MRKAIHHHRHRLLAIGWVCLGVYSIHLGQPAWLVASWFVCAAVRFGDAIKQDIAEALSRDERVAR